MQNPKIKFNIEKNKEDLKMYMFTVQGGPIQIEIAEDFKVVLAYNDNGATELIRKKYPAGVSIHVKKRAQIIVKKIIDKINISTPEIKKVPVPKKEVTVQEFVHGMMLISDVYVENERDKTSIKRIISKIKVK